MTAVLLLTLLACYRAPPAPPVPTADVFRKEMVDGPDLASRLVRDDADLVIFYGGEQRGTLDTCGCPGESHGSLARFSGWVQASKAENPASAFITVLAGYFLEDAIGAGGDLREDVPLMDRWMVQGLAAMPWDAINVAWPDLPGLQALGTVPDLPLTSANVTGPVDLPRIQPHIDVERGKRRYAVVGITSLGTSFSSNPRYSVTEPVPAAEKVLAGLDGRPVILLAWNAIDDARKLAQKHAEIRVIVDAAQHREAIEPFQVGHAIWVRSWFETQRAGELRLWFREEAVDRAFDRKVDLDPIIPDDPVIAAIQKSADREIRAKQKEMYGF